ncbi:hypothetical protein CAL29_28000 [Bordetella genomosp. 10]|uniref:BrnT family toxin n=1 Tax=Bordetella genomosp. 10 TaxID=1416804 RepID=A0A261S2Z5_9BORD|nr:BrnT family toxin [Bordetella genomosp. 10]OZI31719.1 hypothetical protein CAL29_28000 [Bordetella genomosp. 10]
MEITFDPAKDAINQRKHGVSLAKAEEFEWDGALAEEDARCDYGECRMIAIGYIGLRLHVAVYVDRDDARRILSLRKANSREIKRYAKA